MRCAVSFNIMHFVLTFSRMFFEKGLDPVKVQHFVRPDLDPNWMTLWCYS